MGWLWLSCIILPLVLPCDSLRSFSQMVAAYSMSKMECLKCAFTPVPGILTAWLSWDAGAAGFLTLLLSVPPLLLSCLYRVRLSPSIWSPHILSPCGLSFRTIGILTERLKLSEMQTSPLYPMLLGKQDTKSAQLPCGGTAQEHSYWEAWFIKDHL